MGLSPRWRGALVGYFVRGSRYVEHWADGPVLSSWVDLSDIEQAVGFVRRAFRIESVQDHRRSIIETLASEEELTRFRASSGFARTLLEGIERVQGTPLAEGPSTAPGLLVSAQRDGLDPHSLSTGHAGSYRPTEVAEHMAVLEGSEGGPGLRLIVSSIASPGLRLARDLDL